MDKVQALKRIIAVRVYSHYHERVEKEFPPVVWRHWRHWRHWYLPLESYQAQRVGAYVVDNPLWKVEISGYFSNTLTKRERIRGYIYMESLRYLHKWKTIPTFQPTKPHAALFCRNDNDKACLPSSLKMLLTRPHSTREKSLLCR